MKFTILSLLAIAVLAACTPQAPVDTSAALPAKVEAPLAVTDWGPRTTAVAVPVNAFPDGQSGLFIVMSRRLPAGSPEVLFGSRPLGGVVAHDNVITALLPAADLAVAGTTPIAIKLSSGQRIEVGDFVVTELASAGVADPADAAGADPAMPPQGAAAATTDPVESQGNGS